MVVLRNHELVEHYLVINNAYVDNDFNDDNIFEYNSSCNNFLCVLFCILHSKNVVFLSKNYLKTYLIT